MEFSSLNWPYVHNVPHCMKATNLMHLSAAISEVDPGDIRGNRAGFADFCCQFLAWDGGIGPLVHFRDKIHGERPTGFVTSPPS